MKLIFQDIVDKDKGNCQQAAIASLLELPLEEVPNFKEQGDLFWNSCINFVLERGYEFKYFLYNNRLHSLLNYDFLQKSATHVPESDVRKFLDDSFHSIKNEKGVKGFFCAGVYNPRFFDPNVPNPTTHAVIIDKDFNIVNPINPAYLEMKQFPLHHLIGYNGILDIMVINEK